MTLRSLTLLAAAAMLPLIPANSRAETPAPKKRLVVCSATFGFKHSCIPVADATLKELFEASPDLEVVAWIQNPPEKDRKADLSRLDPKWLRENRIDGVVFNNTTGELPLPDLKGFVDWVEEGHGFIGIHAATDTLTKNPLYVGFVGGAFKTHGPQVAVKIHACDTGHPANAGLGPVWEIKQEEIYLVRDQNRNDLRLLWALRHHPNNAKEEGVFPISWCRAPGKGRMFYTSLGHREDLWLLDSNLKGRINPVESATQFRAHLMGGTRWALGLTRDPAGKDGSAVPNPEWK